MKEIKGYFKLVADNFNHIEINNNVCTGIPYIKRTEISVAHILHLLVNGYTLLEISKEFNLALEEVLNALDYTKAILGMEYL